MQQHAGSNSQSMKKTATNLTCPYLLERRDGSMLRASLPLGGSVQDILQSIVISLQDIGAYSLPALSTMEDADPPPRTTAGHHQHSFSLYGDHNFGSTSTGINHQYDVKSRQGRNLQHFLSNLSHEEIYQRRMDRTDAQAAALEVRRVFQFQSVDATSLGWSSASVAVLLKQLLALHEEFASKLRIPSFYPTQLLFTSDDFRESLDVHGGVLRLNPALTKLQWLEKLQLVTEESLQDVKFYRTEMMALAKRAETIYNVRFKKGYSCSSKEFYEFLCLINFDEQTTEKICDSDSTSLVVEPLTVAIESDTGCRRPVVTREGSIRLGAGMDHVKVHSAIEKLSPKARMQERLYKDEQTRCKETIHRVQWEFGVDRVYKTRTVHVAEFVDCLARILCTQEDDEVQRIKMGLTGNSLGVASTGAFCHLADDGAVMIPVDWR